MQDTVPLGQGAMAAVLGTKKELIEEICEQTEGIVTIANYNCPGQIVISGETDAVKKAGESLKEAGARRVVPLKVSGPFHSYMLKEAGEKLLDGPGRVSHAKAMEKAKTEYRKYQQENLSPVEEAYLQSIKSVQKKVSKRAKK